LIVSGESERRDVEVGTPRRAPRLLEPLAVRSAGGGQRVCHSSRRDVPARVGPPEQVELGVLRRRLERTQADLATARRVIEVQGNVSALLEELLAKGASETDDGQPQLAVLLALSDRAESSTRIPTRSTGSGSLRTPRALPQLSPFANVMKQGPPRVENGRGVATSTRRRPKWSMSGSIGRAGGRRGVRSTRPVSCSARV
jgi:hypothetical protein